MSDIVNRLFSLKDLYLLKTDIFKSLKLIGLLRVLKSAGITPNHLTLVNIFIGLVAVYFLFLDHRLFALLLIINIVIDILDGYYARQSQQTSVGMFLDHGGDFILGILILAKSYWFLRLESALIIILLSFIELLIISRLNIWKHKFPTRIFLFFYLFGQFQIGLWFQLFYQPLSLLFVIHRIRRTSSGSISKI